jgi:hypothetical protein
MVVDGSGSFERKVGIGRSNSMAHSRSLSSSSSSLGSSPSGLGLRDGSGFGGKVGLGLLGGVGLGLGRGGGLGFLGSGKSLGASVQSRRHGRLQKRRQGLPHSDDRRKS